MVKAYVDLKNVTRTIKGKTILNDICISLCKGEINGVFGRNGSGKTMLIRAISGLIKVDKGMVNVGGKIISNDRSFPESMGLMIEKIDLWPGLSAFENLRLLADIKNIIDDEQIMKTIERVGLDPEDKRKIRTFSMGMKQKLSLAQALMESPDLLLLDEPTNGFDEESIILFRKLMLEEKERGAAILIATHQKEDIKGLCDRVYKISEGRIEEVSKEEW